MHAALATLRKMSPAAVVVLVGGLVALLAALAWPAGGAGQESDQMVNCPEAGKWSIAVWDGPADTDTESAIDTCADTTVLAAYYLDPETQGWLRWFAGRPEISNLQSLGELRGVLALGGAAAGAAAAAAETLGAAQDGQMVNCPQVGKWSIAVWDGPSGTDTEAALDTCSDIQVDAAFGLDPDTQLFSRFFRGRPEVSNLSTLDEHQGVLALGTAAGAAAAPISFAVDQSVTPGASELAGFEDGAPRPLASVVDEFRNQADFVADELIIVTDDQEALDAFLARWEGEILSSFDPADYGLTGISPMYLVRINAALADASVLEADLRALSGEGEGEHLVSSQQGLDLLAAAASEAADGLDIGVNWVGSGADIRHRYTNDAAGPWGYKNAFGWHYLKAGSVQDIGVTEAWRALDIAEQLDNKVKIAILDMGFEAWEMPEGWDDFSNVAFVDAIGTANLMDCGSPCPWHGTNVASTAMAVPDDDWGSAGVAGPIAEAILGFTLYDFFSSAGAVAEAAVAGADIINMSYGARVPSVLGWTVHPFESATWAVRQSGVLLFTSAGNDQQNVDARTCILGVCWEKAWHTPCENKGVICVGALAEDSTDRRDSSNWGKGRGETVDIWAPGTIWVGPDPDHPGNYTHRVSGTSYASPYAAGVAALIWAADPSLSAGGVRDILYATARSSPDGRVNRYVNAYDAVIEALGYVPNAAPEISILEPEDGSSHSKGWVGFNADADDLEDGYLGDSVVWTSSLDGEFGTGSPVSDRDLSFGRHVITATVTDSSGKSASDSITVTLYNEPPEVWIMSPADGDDFFQGNVIHLRGRSRDNNNVPGRTLADDQVSWEIDGAPFATGHYAAVAAGTLSLGTHTITFTGSDGEFTDTHMVTITILADPADLPPDVTIISPEDGSWFEWDKSVTLEGEATDPEDGPLTGDSLVWTISYEGGEPVTLGTGESLTMPLGTECLPHPIPSELILEATDSAGNTGTDTIAITLDCEV
jgi:serine protease